MFGVDDGILAAGVGAVGNLLGGWMSGSSAASAAADANKSNRQLAREQMAFQERMSSSAYQRAVLDAQKAGLNPYITMTKGPASTPTGTTGAAQIPSNPDYGRGVSSAADSVMRALELRNQALMSKKIQSDIAVNSASAAQTAVETRRLMAAVPVAERDAGIELSTFGTVMQYVNRVLAPVTSALGAVNLVARLLRWLKVLLQILKLFVVILVKFLLLVSHTR